MKVWILTIALFLLFSIPANAQNGIELSGSIGISRSREFGEITPGPIYKGTLSFPLGQYFRIEDRLIFNTVNKYTHAGWTVRNHADVLFYPSGGGFFILGGVAHYHRDGGLWSKQGVRAKVGIGYENFSRTLRGRIFWKEQLSKSPNDSVRYLKNYGYLFNALVPLGRSKWNLGVELEGGVLRYFQNGFEQTGWFYDINYGIAYRWP